MYSIYIRDTDAIGNNFVGHHKLPEKFDPPSNYIQPNNKLIVISNKDNNEENLSSRLHDLFAGNNNKQQQCLVEEKKEKPKTRVSFWKTFDNLMQNKYVWSIFTVFLASLFPISKTIYDYRKKVIAEF